MKELKESDKVILKEIAVNTPMPISKMVDHILKNYELSEEEAKEISYDILNRAGAEYGFKTKYSEC